MKYVINRTVQTAELRRLSLILVIFFGDLPICPANGDLLWNCRQVNIVFTFLPSGWDYPPGNSSYFKEELITDTENKCGWQGQSPVLQWYATTKTGLEKLISSTETKGEKPRPLLMLCFSAGNLWASSPPSVCHFLRAHSHQYRQVQECTHHLFQIPRLAGASFKFCTNQTYPL